MGLMNLFKIIIIVQLFYAFIITGYTHVLPDGAIDYIDPFSELASEISLDQVSSDVQESLESQTDIPLIDVGALVFYSGNIIIDLLMNFAFAIPEMLSLLINGLMMLLSIETYFATLIQLFASVVTIVLYFIGLMEILTSIRSGRAIE